MAIYALGITPLIAWLSKKSKENTNSPPTNQVAFADDLNGIGTLESLEEWWKLLEEEGKKFGYNVNPGKSYLIVKEQCKEKAIKLFENSRIKITTEGHGHLGSVIGSRQFSENYIGLLVSRWCEEITELSLIAKTQPQAAYAAFTAGYRHKFTFFMRTIKNIKQFLTPVEKVIKDKFIPALFNDSQILQELRNLLSLHANLEVWELLIQ